MNGTRLSELLVSLSKEEFLGLEDFLLSPYLNKNKQIILFYYYISAKKTHPDYSEIIREEVFNYIYKSQEFSTDKYLKLSSDFVKAIEYFLVLELHKSRELHNKTLLLEIAGNRNLPKTFSKYYGEVNKSAENEFNKDIDYYNAELEKRVDYMLYHLHSKKFNLEKALMDINEAVNLITVYNKLDIMLKLLHINDNKESIFFEKEILRFIESDKENIKNIHPMIYVKYRILKMFRNLDLIIYDELKVFLTNNENRLSKINLGYIYDNLITFCSIIGDDRFKSEEFELIKSLERNSMLSENAIDYVYFMKTVETALSENDSYWAETFVDKYKVKIDNVFREDTVNLAMASICIYRQNFDFALQYVSKVKAINDYFYLSSKTFSLIIFYEMNDNQSIEFTLEAFSIYLYRNKNKIDYKSYKIFLSYFRQLNNVKLNSKKESGKNALMKSVNEQMNLLNKDWFVRKLEGI